jgi:hypothetical protein
MTRRCPRRPVPLPPSARSPPSTWRVRRSGRAASRTASASASRSSLLGIGRLYSPSCRTTSQPFGTVRRRACASQRSYECGSAYVASGPTTAVESE